MQRIICFSFFYTFFWPIWARECVKSIKESESPHQNLNEANKKKEKPQKQQQPQQRRRLSLTYIRYTKDNNKTIAQAAQQQPQPATTIKHKPKRVCLPNLLLDQLTFPTATNTKQQQQQPTNGHVCACVCACVRCVYTHARVPLGVPACLPVCECVCVGECVSVLLLMTT